MYREEADQLTTCLDCGAEFAAGTDRDFALASSGAVCWECAKRRGGTYDENQSRWVVAPDVSDLETATRDVD